MRQRYGNPIATALEIQGHFVPARDKIVRPWIFTDYARACWPSKTAEHLAAISGKDERTAKRWLAGEFEPPIVVVFAVINKMFERATDPR